MYPHLIEVGLMVGPLVVWFALYGVILLAARPAVPEAAPATEDLGPEPPAVASLLVNRWTVTVDAAESTLIDLAARHILEFRQPANDARQTTVHVRVPAPTGLSGYEKLVFDRVSGLAAGGVVPLTALTFRDSDQAQAWSKRLTAEVVGEARRHGLSRRRLGPRVVSALVAAAVAAAVSVGAGVGLWRGRADDHDTGGQVLIAAAVTFFVLAAVAARPHGERDTDAGREAAARWLGVRAWLRGHEAFGDLPPSAVAVWDRYLSYGAAVGATRVASDVIDLGMGSRRRVWSSYGGQPGAQPSWHRVRVRYPRYWSHYGKSAARTALRGVVFTAIGIGLLKLWLDHSGAIDIGGLHRAADDPVTVLVDGAGLALGLLAAAYGLYLLARTVVDLVAPATVTGEVVWMERWRSSGGEHPQPVLHYLAVDDASADATRAWALPHAMSGRCADGDVVTIRARPWSRLVLETTVVSQGNLRKLAQADLAGHTASEEDMIAAAMGIPVPRSGGRAAGPLGGFLTAITPIGPLVSPEEVGAALGMPVTVRPLRGRSHVAPMEVTEYAGPDGSAVLTVVRSGGAIARMAMRTRARGEALYGIGDEARGGSGWIAARRGDEVVMLHLGQAAQATPPAAFAGLAHAAANRLPATVG